MADEPRRPDEAPKPSRLVETDPDFFGPAPETPGEGGPEKRDPPPAKGAAKPKE